MEPITAIALAAVKIAELQDEFKLNNDRYTVFQTDETDPAKFWDSLNNGKFMMYGNKERGRWKYFIKKHEVGELAIHQGFMNVNFCWDAGKTKFKDLPKSQQKIIISTFKTRKEPYTPIAIRAISKKLFKI